MTPRVALAVRPYPEPLRGRVFRLLSSLSITVDAPQELGVGVSNHDAIRYIAARRPDLLLVPFHVVRGAGGERTTGIELLSVLRRALPQFERVPAVVPVSVFAEVAFEKVWREAPWRQVFPLIEREMEDKETRAALRRFLTPGAEDTQPGALG